MEKYGFDWEKNLSTSPVIRRNTPTREIMQRVEEQISRKRTGFHRLIRWKPATAVFLSVAITVALLPVVREGLIRADNSGNQTAAVAQTVFSNHQGTDVIADHDAVYLNQFGKKTKLFDRQPDEHITLCAAIDQFLAVSVMKTGPMSYKEIRTSLYGVDLVNKTAQKLSVPGDVQQTIQWKNKVVVSVFGDAGTQSIVQFDAKSEKGHLLYKTNGSFVDMRTDGETLALGSINEIQLVTNGGLQPIEKTENGDLHLEHVVNNNVVYLLGASNPNPLFYNGNVRLIRFDVKTGEKRPLLDTATGDQYLAVGVGKFSNFYLVGNFVPTSESNTTQGKLQLWTITADGNSAKLIFEKQTTWGEHRLQITDFSNSDGKSLITFAANKYSDEKIIFDPLQGEIVKP